MIGIDLGSRSVKIVEFTDGILRSSRIIDTIGFYRRYRSPEGAVLRLDFTQLGLTGGQVVATGYGKINVDIEGANKVPEIQAHVAGACFQSGQQDFTLLDIGGQDTKVVKVRKGRAVDFMTNDRCAASSGRYLENMAAVIGMSLEELSRYHEDPVDLNATCAIFGETEVIGRIVEGCSQERLAAGINYALYRRFSTLLARLHSPVLLVAGGGALNKALLKILQKETGSTVIRLAEPQLNGAIGCCVLGDNCGHTNNISGR